MSSSNLAIILPVYNEVNTIEEVLNKIIKNIASDDRIFLIQDGSNDGTAELTDKLSKNKFFADNNITYVNHPQNKGYGQALISGFHAVLENGRFTKCLTIDCDKQHQPSDIPRFKAHPKIDIISASRYLKSTEKGIKAPEDRQAINHKITQKLSKLAKDKNLGDWTITDAFCGMKRYNMQMIDDFLKEINNIKETDYVSGYGFPLLFWRFYLSWIEKQEKSLQKSFIELSIARIYITNDRSFGETLDYPLKRYRYYLKCLSIPY